ncbi:hypothetical protein [Phormidium sp. CCY1219]|uniref:hypothetical protein n=1 Tax=Phormidium sp. CCY1219 TaxID=2886104 RepID=UPI002D1E5305|nr:hypothetical protein [Phormidium sp. CCY1219]MEB3826133.1 hypothetical protein [Phormidium sp. CCY1219]
MRYLKYLRLLVSSFLICWIIFLLAFFYQLGVQTTKISAWIDNIYVNKERIARSIDTPKLIVVAGSNALYGISCEAVAAQTGVPCVNAATHGTLGTDYIFRKARSLAKPTDIVLLPLEYHFYKQRDTLNNVFIDYVVASNPSYLLSLNPFQQIRFVLGTSFPRLLNGMINKTIYYLNSEPRENTNLFLNEYGDIKKNKEANITSNLIHIVAEEKPMELQGYLRSTSGMKSIRKFVEWARENQIQVIATWPNTIGFDVYQEAKSQEYFQSIKDFYQEIGVPVLGEPEDFMYDKSMFYDTSYHLHDRGTRHRTRQTIDLLLPYLAPLREAQ